MGAVKKLIDKKALQTFVPINALSAGHVEEISRKAIIEDVRSGTYVFKHGDRDYQTVYVLDGKVELVDNKRNVVGNVTAGTESARHPLAHKQPRQLGARAVGKVTVARIDSSLLDVLLTWDESSGYDVQEIDAQDDDDWMTRMLQSQAFLQLPPSNIHQLLMRLEAVSANAGEVVVRQGEDGDYFYIVKSGRLAVTRKASVRSKEVLLAELGEGACFGEEALVSGTKRNASVMMITNGSLMRLSKTDFDELLCASLVHETDFEDAQELVDKGAKWLDVRLPGEFENQSIKDSINVPLSALREHAKELDGETEYIVCCDTGRRSAAGAFVLSQLGLSVYTLKSGLMDVPDDALTATSASADKPVPVHDADIIPFGSESSVTRPSAVSDDDNQLIDKLAQLEADKQALQQQLQAMTAERERQASQQEDAEALRARLTEVEQQSVASTKEQQDLQDQLAQVRDDYAQLGQRTSQVAGERDAAVNALDEMGGQLSQAQEQAQTAGSEQETLSQSLTSLQVELNGAHKDRDQQAQEREQLEQQLNDLRQQVDTASQAAEEQAEQDRHAVLAEKDDLAQRLESLQQELQENNDKLQQAEAAVQEQKQQEDAHHDEWQSKFNESEERATALESGLDSERSRYTEAEQRIATLDGQLAERDKQHEIDIGSTREAMSRAQTETENLKREQTRLMEKLRKLERNLERERHDHESETHRLHKELKEAAGESSAGLAEEVDALQAKVKVDARARDDLEILLGERSAQIDNLKADTEKLDMQLKQAQESACQAEEQLLEGNRMANEEMAVRIEAEEKAQAALRDELVGVIAERNRSQEQFTVQQHELDELRTGLDAANQALTTSVNSVSTFETQVSELSAERDTAMERYQPIQQELDQLRAEAEVTRGLIGMQVPAGEADAALREELDQAKQNVDVAVRLRGQAEQRVGELEVELEQLRSQSVQAEAEAPVLLQGHIPSLDDADPMAATVLVDEYPTDEEYGDSAATVLLEDEESVAIAPAEESLPSAGQGGGKGLMMGVLAVVLALAGGTGWWFMQQPSTGDEAVPSVVAVMTAETTDELEMEIEVKHAEPAKIDPLPEPVVKDPEPEPEPDESESEKPRFVPSFDKGGSDKVLVDSLQDTDKVGDPAQAVDDEIVATVPEDSPVPAPVKQQPVRTYSQPLSDGGSGPTVVEFQADSYEMGSGSTSANFDERPRHSVEISSFAISRHEITFADYDRFTRVTGRKRPGDNGWGRGNRPVINVSWADAVAYAEWLSVQTGSYYRLPTEAEWEFVARAGSEARFWWGNKVGASNANCFDCGSEWSGMKTAPAGSFDANAYAVQDMLGNAMEWVQDCYQKSYASAPTDGSAVGAADCDRRVVRGGGFDSPANSARSSSRDSLPGTSKLNNLGFRVVKARR